MSPSAKKNEEPLDWREVLAVQLANALDRRRERRRLLRLVGSRRHLEKDDGC